MVITHLALVRLLASVAAHVDYEHVECLERLVPIASLPFATPRVVFLLDGLHVFVVDVFNESLNDLELQ